MDGNYIITFCKLEYTNTVDVRVWRREKDKFQPTTQGFSLVNTEQIICFVNIQDQIEMKLKERSILEEHINVSRSVLTQYSYKIVGFIRIKLPTVEEFTYKFRDHWEEMNSINDIQSVISTRDLFHYVTKTGSEALKNIYFSTSQIARSYVKVWQITTSSKDDFVMVPRGAL